MNLEASPLSPPLAQAELLVTIRNLFVGREDAYLDEQRGSVKKPLTDAVLLDHLQGRRRMGAYSLLPNGTAPNAKFLCLDFDGKNLPGGKEEALDQANRAAEVLEERGFAAYRELSRSGVGFHVWVFFGDFPVSLRLTQRFGQVIISLASLPGETEIFPKGQADSTYGGTPYLPLHGLLNGKPSTCFVGSRGEVLEDQIGLLAEAKCATAEGIERTLQEHETPDQSPGRELRVADESGWIVQSLEGVPQGKRHDTLVRLAGYFRAKHPLEVSAQILRVFGERCQPPILPSEVGRTLDDVYRRYSGPRRGPHVLDLDNPPPSPEYLVEHWLIPSGLTYLAGPQGSAKSLGGLDLAISFAMNTRWLDRFAVRNGGSAVYWDEENGEKLVYRRLERLTQPKGISPRDLTENFAAVCKQGITDANSAGWTWFADMCAERQPRLIVLDTLRAIFTGNEDSSQEAEVFLHRLYELQEMAGNPPFFILCHPGKKRSRGIRGSSRWPQSADLIINLASLPGRGHVKGVSWAKIRDGAEEPDPFAFRVTDVDGGISLETTAMSPSDKAREMRNLHPDWTHEQIADALGVSRSTVTRALQQMERVENE